LNISLHKNIFVPGVTSRPNGAFTCNFRVSYIFSIRNINLKKIPHPPVILGGSFEEITKLLDSTDLH